MKVALASIVVWLALVVSVFMFADVLSGIFFVAPPAPIERGPVLPEVVPKAEAKEALPEELPYVAPAEVKGIFLTSATALNEKQIEHYLKVLNNTELNALVINVNDNLSPDKLLQLKPVIETLNENGVHTIARIATFQNEQLINQHPELALHWSNGSIWYDGGGHRWVDPADPKVWDEIEKLSRQAIELGFKEINYDYVRFPSDGAIKLAVYNVYDGESKSEVINNFGAAMRARLKPDYPDIILSADIFAHAILVDNDAGIGQNFISIVDYFDVICPMVYPSHYAPGNFGYENPAAAPYAVAYGTMLKAYNKLEAANKLSSATIRPWFQDFSLGAYYGTKEVQAQIKANTDAGFNSGWLLWNARNVYTESALQINGDALITS